MNSDDRTAAQFLQRLSYGKLRGLQCCANESGIFTVLALDHRGVLKKVFGTEGNSSAIFGAIASFKQHVLTTLAPACTAVLLDPAFGAGPAIARGAISGNQGLIVTLEESGYAGDPTARISRIAENWGVDRIKRMGGSAVKLLVYYHPESRTAEPMQELLVEVAQACRKHDIALFLETLSYALDAEQSQLSSEQRRRVAVQTARQLTPLGADVYKTEFPLNVKQTPHEGAWVDACSELSEAAVIPWVLLSAGVDFETFARQTEVACQAGASGILAGRAIWKEAASLPVEQRGRFLAETAVQRMYRLSKICHHHARPFTQFFSGVDAREDWYRHYEGYGCGDEQ